MKIKMNFFIQIICLAKIDELDLNPPKYASQMPDYFLSFGELKLTR